MTCGYTRNCPNCGGEFEVSPHTMSKIYCSEDCKRELNREHNRDLAKKRRRKNHSKVWS